MPPRHRSHRDIGRNVAPKICLRGRDHPTRRQGTIRRPDRRPPARNRWPADLVRLGARRRERGGERSGGEHGAELADHPASLFTQRGRRLPSLRTWCGVNSVEPRRRSRGGRCDPTRTWTSASSSLRSACCCSSARWRSSSTSPCTCALVRLGRHHRRDDRLPRFDPAHAHAVELAYTVGPLVARRDAGRRAVPDRRSDRGDPAHSGHSPSVTSSRATPAAQPARSHCSSWAC